MFFKNSFFRGHTHRHFRLSGRLHVLLHQNQHWDRSPRPCNRHHVRPRQVVPRAHTEPQEESTTRTVCPRTRMLLLWVETASLCLHEIFV